jgi:general secretion pathway protein N
MSLRPSALLGIVCGALFALVAYAPATWLAGAIAQASQQRVLLQNTIGTVWSGSAHLVLSGGSGSADAMQLPTRLEWKITPQLWGVQLQIQSACCTTQSPIQLTINRQNDHWQWQLDAKSVVLPAQWLVGLGAPWNTLRMTGTLTLQAQTLQGQIKQGKLVSLTGQASLQGTQIQTALSTIKPLGNYTAQLNNQTIRLGSTDGSALMLSGRGQISESGFQLQGEALAEKGREDALGNLMHVIGQRQASGDGRLRSVFNWG